MDPTVRNSTESPTQTLPVRGIDGLARCTETSRIRVTSIAIRNQGTLTVHQTVHQPSRLSQGRRTSTPPEGVEAS